MPIVLLHKAGIVPRAPMKYQAVKIFQKMFVNMSEEEVREFFQKAAPALRHYYNPEVLEEVKKAKREGFHLVLLSGAYALLLEMVARELGIHTVIGAELYFKDGTTDYSREVSFVDGKNKLSLLKKAFADENVDWKASRSYGDSYDDLLVLEIVGEAVVVNPEHRLLNYAQNNDWRVIELSG